MNNPLQYTTTSDAELRDIVFFDDILSRARVALSTLLVRAEARGYEAGVKYGHAQGSVAASVKQAAAESP